MLIGNDKTIGIRITNEFFSQQLCQQFGGPIVSTSANISGEESPRCFSDIRNAILESVDYICESRREEKKKTQSSIIVKVDAMNRWKILRC